MEDGYGLDSVHDLNQRYKSSLKYPLDSFKNSHNIDKSMVSVLVIPNSISNRRLSSRQFWLI